MTLAHKARECVDAICWWHKARWRCQDFGGSGYYRARPDFENWSTKKNGIEFYSTTYKLTHAGANNKKLFSKLGIHQSNKEEDPSVLINLNMIMSHLHDMRMYQSKYFQKRHDDINSIIQGSVVSHLECCVTFLSTTFKKDEVTVEQVQRRKRRLKELGLFS